MLRPVSGADVSTPRHAVSRRRVVAAAAWAAPVVAVSTAAPAFAASPNDVVIGGTVCGLHYGSGTLNRQVHWIDLGVNSTQGFFPQGSRITWTITMSGGGPGTGGTNQVPALSYTPNNAWTLTTSPSTGTATSSFTVTLTFNRDYTISGTQWCGPRIQWTDIYTVRPGATVTGRGTTDTGTVTESSLSYQVARRHPTSVNTAGRTPHVYLTRTGAQTCWPSINWTRAISTNGYDNQTRYPDGTVTPQPGGGPVSGQYVTPQRC